MKLGVVLFQLSGPDARQPLAKLISTTRARKVEHHYAEIGGKSPTLENTVRQAAALEAMLRADYDVRAVVAMRCWRPFTAEAIGQLERHHPM